MATTSNPFLQDTEYDEDSYNIIPFAEGRTNCLPDEVKEAIASLKWGIDAFPSSIRGHDVLHCLQIHFKFQEGSVSNQRENIVNLLSNEQMRLGEHETAFEGALKNVFLKTLDNYTKWCSYLSIKPIWENTDENAAGEGENAAVEGENATAVEVENAAAEGENAAVEVENAAVEVENTAEGENAAVEGENAAGEDKNDISKEKKILYISLYYLIWGEAANVRFLPECLCYIFHCMSRQVDKYLRLTSQQLDDQYEPYQGSFIDEVIKPLYDVIAAEAKIKKEKNVPHSKWRNYDDFNEYFWSPECFQLGWPLNLNSPFFQRPIEGSTVFGKTSFVEHRTFWHLYHSFHRMWIFHVMMFEALVIFAFNDGNPNYKTLRETLTVTYFLMKLFQSILHIVLKYGAYCNTSWVDVLRILVRFIWSMLATLAICFPRMKCLQEKTSSIEESIGFENYVTVLGIHAVNFRTCLQEKTSLIEESIGFKNYITVLGIYAAFKISFPILCQFLPSIYKNSFVARSIKWINQEEYVGRGMDEKPTDYIKYMFFWLITLGINFAFTYYLLIRPLVRPTRDITDVSQNIPNMLATGSLWAGVICAYIVGSHISYNVISAFVGTFVGHRDRLGNIKSLGDVHKCFDKIPTAFMDHLHSRESPLENNQEVDKKLLREFSPFWNQIVRNLRQEDYISDLEKFALSMPEKSECIDVIQWPLFLLVGKVSLAIKIAAKSDPLKDMRGEISRDVYMRYAVEECFHSVKIILKSVLNDDQGKGWVEGICNDIDGSIARNGNLCSEFQLNQLDRFVEEISTLILNMQKDLNIQVAQRNSEPVEILKNVIQHDFLGTKKIAEDKISVLSWPTNPELRSQIERLHLLLTMDKSADHVPRNGEARRRLEFFTNSLFMSMPKPKPVREMLSFSVLTPYYEETVIYSKDELDSRNDDGVTLIDYLKNLYPDEWINYCERIKDKSDRKTYELRLWASYRGQTLARTVRGTMYYQLALLLQAFREMLIAEGVDGLPSTSPVDVTIASGSDVSIDKGSQSLNKCLYKTKAHVDLKFTYVVSCQIYGKQKIKDKEKAADIAFLLKSNEGLRVAFVDQVNNEFYSKLLKADKNGKETEVYSIKLPGNPILGEGKPENQNHAIVFTRGNAIQAIDMNQDNYFEETLKMRNLLEEFHRKDGKHPPTILGIREHIFTGSASSLASFMSNQETGFVTLGQRVIAKPLKVRMHYGHPDVFDRVFHITRGGISKASRGINVSEDIYAGFNSTLRQGSVTHHEYIQVGKGRDVGFNQIATFEGKVAGGNGEQVLSRDMYRLGQRFDFFRMLSFYYTTVGYYFSSLLMVITLYILLYGNLIMPLSGTRVPHVLNNTAMTPDLFLMIVLLPASYIILVLILEQGFEKAVESILTMYSRLCSIFFSFSLGTRIYWFGRTMKHGGASYQATGRGFVLHHIKFLENYRLYSRSHFVKGMEVLFLLAVYGIYGFHSVRAIYNNLLLFGGLILSISWIVAPFLFDSSQFDPYKNLEDWEDWNNWLRNCKSVPVDEGVPVEEKSWEAWWYKELAHIRTPKGRIIETILSVRFFIFPLVVGYNLDEQGLIKSLSNCVIPWICIVGILFAHECFSNETPVKQFFSISRVATIGAFAVAIACYYSGFGDMLAFTIAIITTILGFISFFSDNRVATVGALAIAYYYSAFGDMLAFIIAIITTVWGFLSICVAWRPILEIFSLWTPVKYLAWICDTGMRALSFNISISDACEAWKPTLEIFSLWTPVTYLAWIFDTGMGALMFKIANMFSHRSIKRYLVRNMFDHNVSEYLQKTSAETATLSGRDIQDMDMLQGFA